MIDADVRTVPHVLVVDDERRIAEEIAEMLNRFGAVAIACSDALCALDELAARPDITVLLTDLRMPALNGFTLADAAVAERRPEQDLQVILMTGHGGLGAVEAAFRHGFVDYQQKPSRPMDMKVAVMRAHLRALDHRARARAAAPPVAAEDADAFKRMDAALRGPLAMIGHLKNALAARPSGQDEGKVQRSTAALNRCESFVRQFTDRVAEIAEVAETAELRRVAETAVVEPLAVLADLDARHQVSAAAANVRLQLRWQTEPYIALRTDRGRLRRAIGEVLECVIEAAPKGTTVTLAVWQALRHVAFVISNEVFDLDDSRIRTALRACEETGDTPFPLVDRAGIKLELAEHLVAFLGGKLMVGHGDGETGFQIALVLPCAPAGPAQAPVSEPRGV
jgi:CheY-like chemotaxis protein